MHFDRSPVMCSCEEEKKEDLNDFKSGTFIGHLPSDGAVSVAVKRLNMNPQHKTISYDFR